MQPICLNVKHWLSTAMVLASMMGLVTAPSAWPDPNPGVASPAVGEDVFLPILNYHPPSKPVGVFGADPSEFGQLLADYDMNLTLSSLGSVDNTLSGLESAVATGFKVVGALNLPPPRDDQGRFSMDEFKSIVDSYALQSAALAPYIADGSFYAHILFDEPCDASAWGGVANTREQIREAADYSRDKLKGLPISVGTGNVDCMSQLLPGDADIPLAPYTILKAATIQQFIDDNVAALEANGWVSPKLIVSINVFNGFPAGQIMSAADVTNNAVVACAHPNVDSVMWWEWHGPQAPDFASIVASNPAYQDALRAGTAACQ